ncbi:class I SAM-dependent methyltransferase [Acidobacteria bacterium AH-259-O06]|nr:class I SAM-dependent methyltransferase [Acidobacteria bacterium AH-259-O06]
MKRSGSVIDGKKYFDEIAPKYDHLRGSEIWSSLLSSIGSFDHKGSPVLDIATGTGLFSVRLAAQGFHVLGLDRNPRMLMQAMRKAREQHCSFQAVLGSAEQLPLLGNSIAVMFSTNAVHHFDIREHFTEVQRVLRPRGYYVVYTRFREQNARSIWGRFFPHFSEKEIRLYKPEHFERLDQEFPELALESLDEFSFEKPFSRDRLLQVARQRKYSTFALYSEAEFRQAYATFSSRLNHWSDKFYLAEMGRIVFRRR